MSKSPLLTALKRLSGWFERQKRVLPWRNQPTLYRVWVSEIMLQQTQVATVVPYFERFMERFPTVEVLARADAEEVMRYWAGLGYYSRARNLHRAAQQILAQGDFPRTREQWLKIPGVGHYTAGAILSIALDQPEAILDGNVERVLSRLWRVDRQKGDAEFKARLWQRSKEMVQLAAKRGIRPSVTNQALMELGATTCSPKSPKCLLCPVQSFCEAYAHGEQETYPPRKKPKKWIAVQEELHCVLDEEGRVLVRERVKGEWRAGLWDLLEKRPQGLKLKALGEVETRHVVTRHKVSRRTHVWRMGSTGQNLGEINPSETIWSAAESSLAEGESSPPERRMASQNIKWVSVSSPDVPVGSALKRTLAQVRERFPEAWQIEGYNS